MNGMSINIMRAKRVKALLLASALGLGLTACGDSGTELNAERHLERANAYEDQGQYRAAIIEFKNAVKKSAGESGAIVAYASMLNELGQHQSALALLDQFQGKPDAVFTAVRIESLMGAGKYRSAKEVLNSLDSLPAHERTLFEARLALSDGDLSKAETLFRSLHDHPEVGARARLGTASLLARGQQYAEAAGMVSSINEQSDSYARARLLLAGINIANNELDRAESVLSDLLAKLPNTDLMKPERATALERLAYVLTRLGRSNEAYVYTKLLAEAYPGANEVNDQYRSAVQHFQEGELESARTVLLGITEKYPNYDKANQLLGVISYLKGETQKASEILSGSVDPEVADPITTHIYAASQLKLNDPKRVLEILEPGIQDSELAQTWVLYGLAALSDRQYDKAEKALLKGVELAPEDVRVRLSVASFYEVTPRADKNKKWQQLDTALALAPEDREVLQSVVSHKLKHDGVAAAETFIDAHAKRFASGFVPQLIAGYFHASQNQFDRALEYFTAASKLSAEGENSRDALFARGKVELALGRLDAAESTFRSLIKSFPKQPEGYQGLYTSLLQSSGNDAATAELLQLGKRNAVAAPFAVLIRNALGRKDLSAAKEHLASLQEFDDASDEQSRLMQAIQFVEAGEAMRQGDVAKARENIVSLLAERPESLRLLSLLVDVEVRAGALKEARKVLAQIEELYPSTPAVPVLRGDIAFAAKDLEGAQGYYQKAWNQSPTNLAGEKLFRVLAVQKKETEQSRHLKDWLEKIPNSAQALLYQGMRQQQRGLASRAASTYESLLKLAPDNVAALNNLGWLYFEQGRDEAVQLLSRAAQLAPQSPAVLDSYGWVLFKRGEKEKGLALLEKANRLAPDNKEIAAHLEEAKGQM